MDLFPLWNSLRVAGISTAIIFFVGIFAAYYIAKAPRVVKGVLDVILTLPLVLPPTVVGFLLLRVLGPKRVIGAWFLETFGLRLTMTWWSARSMRPMSAAVSAPCLQRKPTTSARDTFSFRPRPI